MKSLVNLGKFEIKSGEVVISDPCFEYNEDEKIMHSLPSVMNGIWIGLIEFDLDTKKSFEIIRFIRKIFSKSEFK